MPSMLPPFSPGPMTVGMIPSPAVSPPTVGRNLYEQPMPFQSPDGDFEIERGANVRGTPRPTLRRAVSDYASDALLQTSIANVIAAKARPFVVTGRIPVDPATLTLFFRSKVSGFLMSSDTPSLIKRSSEWNHALPRFPDRC